MNELYTLTHADALAEIERRRLPKAQRGPSPIPAAVNRQLGKQDLLDAVECLTPAPAPAKARRAKKAPAKAAAKAQAAAKVARPTGVGSRGGDPAKALAAAAATAAGHAPRSAAWWDAYKAERAAQRAVLASA